MKDTKLTTTPEQVANRPRTISELVAVLRHPAQFLGSAAADDLEADYEEGDWTAVPDEIRGVLDHPGHSLEWVVAKLELTARFLRIHGLRLHGHPWLHIMRFRDMASISYVLHLDLDSDAADIWNSRYSAVLTAGDLLSGPLYMALRMRGPLRQPDQQP